MKSILTTLLFLVSLVCFSQSKVQLEVENENGKETYKLKFQKEVDGQSVLTEKIYSSMEEMKNDPELKELDLHFMEGHGSSFKSKDGNVLIEIDEDVEEGNHKVMFISKGDVEHVEMKIWVDEDGTKHVTKNGEEVVLDELHEEGNHEMMFMSTGGEGEHTIEVIVDEDGTKRVLKNGVEVDTDELHEKGNNVFVFETDGKGNRVKEEQIDVEVTVDEDGNHRVIINGEEVDYEEWKKDNQKDTHSLEWVEEGEDGKHVKKEVIIIKQKGEGNNNVLVEVIVKNIVLHLEDVSEEDYRAFSLEENKELKLDEFNFYPNPSNGTFQLKFAGKERPTLIKVTDINGKELYNEKIQDFSGSYENEINLSGLKKGIYLLQVVQGNKAINKKIVIE